MRIVINTIDGGQLDIADFDQASLMTMLEEWDNLNVLGFALDNGTMAYIPKSSVARIDTY